MVVPTVRFSCSRARIAQRSGCVTERHDGTHNKTTQPKFHARPQIAFLMARFLAPIALILLHLGKGTVHNCPPAVPLLHTVIERAERTVLGIHPSSRAVGECGCISSYLNLLPTPPTSINLDRYGTGNAA